mmetsp:Transcript_23265/g.38292  ORF Transcript_23265/g.38292 Transcript_23265/m.38292 type:complete len:304 (+) Transcript_23265:158-1069(+)
MGQKVVKHASAKADAGSKDASEAPESKANLYAVQEPNTTAAITQNAEFPTEEEEVKDSRVIPSQPAQKLLDKGPQLVAQSQPAESHMEAESDIVHANEDLGSGFPTKVVSKEDSDESFKEVLETVLDDIDDDPLAARRYQPKSARADESSANAERSFFFPPKQSASDFNNSKFREANNKGSIVVKTFASSIEVRPDRENLTEYHLYARHSASGLNCSAPPDEGQIASMFNAFEEDYMSKILTELDHQQDSNKQDNVDALMAASHDDLHTFARTLGASGGGASKVEPGGKVRTFSASMSVQIPV